jgi:iron complex outermembrane receptor protein
MSSPPIPLPYRRLAPARLALPARVRRAFTLLGLGWVAASSPAQFADTYAELSLEALMNVTVTSVTKTDVRLLDTAAAVTVLSHDDLRRSGASTVAETLRLVPGMNVGAVNASQWSISTRGFNNLYANKLLVLVDGRAVYSTNYSGVYWDLQQTMLADVDRIEAIRGTGAAVWGANAVNGVVNILTRSSRETQGTLLHVGLGDVEHSHFAVRHGGRLGERTFFRVFASERHRDDSPGIDAPFAQDAWRGRSAGFRLDHHARADVLLTWQADGTWSDWKRAPNRNRNASTLARWSRILQPGATAELQTYLDQSAHDGDVRIDVTTYDVAGQYATLWGERHRLVAGAGYRHVHTELADRGSMVLVEHRSSDRTLASAFLQNETGWFEDRLRVTAGAKLEHHDTVGVEFQPSLRATFKPSAEQAVWGALSRAVRTPSELEYRSNVSVVLGEPTFIPGGGVFLPLLVGNRQIRSETVESIEFGYRGKPWRGLNVDLAFFHHDYDGVTAWPETPERLIPGIPIGRAELPMANRHHAEARGGEGTLTLLPTARTSLSASHSVLWFKLEGPADTVGWARSAPRHQSLVRLDLDLVEGWSLNATWRYVGAIRDVPAYNDADVRLAWRRDGYEAALVGQNLLSPSHRETPRMPLAPAAEVPRSVQARVTVRF